MHIALQHAALAAAEGEVPVGAVVVREGRVIGCGHNRPVQTCDPSAHAEMLALRAAASARGNYRLDDCTLYVTLEPCAMCSGGILHSRIKRLVYGAADPKTGCAGSVLNLFDNPSLNHQTEVERGVMSEQAGALLQAFFRQQRARHRAAAVPLREDALRTPERCFAPLPDHGWESQYISNLPGLAGLRLHFIDEGPKSDARVRLFVHPVPGWSYSYQPQIAEGLAQGMRVLAPDLIGFGRSDKPKREHVHSQDFHLRYLAQLLQRLDLYNVELVSAGDLPWLVTGLRSHLPDRICSSVLLPPSPVDDAVQRAAWDAPYPDTGHRAGDRAFAALKQR
jgi:tRNA(adenine34) deaminase